MELSDFDYHLPEHHIAQVPLQPRDHSKLMILDRDSQNTRHHRFFELADFLKEGDVLVFNQSRVIPARLKARMEGKNKEAEIFLLRSMEENRWECLVKPGKWFKEGDRFKVVLLGEGLRKNELWIKVESVRPTGERVIHFECDDLDACIKTYGQMPVPPYIQQKPEDPERYQTVYAKPEGSVAAPTAGLHFTGELLEKLRQKGVQMEFVTLHVGLGTFQTVKAEKITDHHMHSEFFQLNQPTSERLNEAKKQGKRIIAVGTTSVRVLESCANDFDSLARKDEGSAFGQVQPHSGKTDIFIYPGYQWRFVDGMITNFHLPKSTLLMLVSSFASAKRSHSRPPLLSGRDFILEAYREAIENNYRFFSFGDAMMIV